MGTRRILFFRLRAILCIALVLQLHFLPGCATSIPSSLDEWITVTLTPDHPLAIALERTIFSGASAIEVNPALMAFRLVSPDGSRFISGAMQARGDGAAVRTMRISSDAVSLDLVVDASDHITRISTGDGRVWMRPSDNSAPDLDVSLINSYMTANQELLDYAAAQDGAANDPGSQPGTDNGNAGSTGKTIRSNQLSTSLQNLINVLSVLLVPQLLITNFGTIAAVIGIFVALQATFSLLNGGSNSGGGTNGGTNGGTSGGSTSSLGVSGARAANSTLRVTNVLESGVPIWYVVPVPMTGESPLGNLLGNEAIPSGESRDFKIPAGNRTINLICPASGDCLRIYPKNGVLSVDGETVEIILSGADRGNLYPADCGGG